MPARVSRVRRGSTMSRSLMGRLPPVNSGAKGQLEHRGTCVMQQPRDTVTMPELNLDEVVRVRELLSELIRNEYITNKFDLRVVLSEVGIYPSDEELSLLLGAYENKISFNNFCNYLRFYKKKFQLLEQSRRKDNHAGSTQQDGEDTLRAFVSLGGCEDGTGSVNLKDLRQACHNFGLTIDIDGMLYGIVDTENQSTLSYLEFCCMWQSRGVSRSDRDSTLSVQESTADSQGRTSTSFAAREDREDAFRFPQSPSVNMPTTTLLQSEALHLSALRQFLLQESEDASPMANSLAERSAKDSRFHILPQISSTGTNELDQRRKKAARPEKGGDDDAGILTTAGGFRAPSPMILSLRNTPAYKQRMQAFAQKIRMRSTSRGGVGWKSAKSPGPDDDSGRG